MRYLTIVLALTACTLARPAQATDEDTARQLLGVWRLTSFKLQLIGEAAPREPFGPNPFGYLILTPERRMMGFISRPDRHPPTNDKEAAELLRSMIAYTGRYRVEGDKLITKVDGAWNEIFKANEQVRYFTVDGDHLSIRTAEQPSAVEPSARIVGTLTEPGARIFTLTWERER